MTALPLVASLAIILACAVGVADSTAQVTGLLRFEAGHGYYLVVDPRGNRFAAARIWLRVSEDKVLVGQLMGLAGRRVRIEGHLRQLPANVLGAAIPAKAIVLEQFRLLENKEP